MKEGYVRRGKAWKKDCEDNQYFQVWRKKDVDKERSSKKEEVRTYE